MPAAKIMNFVNAVKEIHFFPLNPYRTVQCNMTEVPAQVQCDICTDELYIPFSFCDRHTACYRCCWNTVVFSEKWSTYKHYVSWVGNCPFCRKEITISIFGDNYDDIKSDLKPLPDTILLMLDGKKNRGDVMKKCPFVPCPFSGDVVAMSSHCLLYTSPSPRD
jgi:hypothetical protein